MRTEDPLADPERPTEPRLGLTLPIGVHEDDRYDPRPPRGDEGVLAERFETLLVATDRIGARLVDRRYRGESRATEEW